MKRHALLCFASALLPAILIFAQTPGRRVFIGVITDSDCPKGDHSQMQMGSNDAECTIACVEQHGDTYLLFDGKSAYNLSDQNKPRAFAGKRAAVTGTLDAKTNTIKVDSIAAAK